MASKAGKITDHMLVGKLGEAGKAPALPSGDMATASIHLSADLLMTLRMVANRRARTAGGRPSVSDVVREILDQHRDELVAEASGKAGG